MTLHLARKWFSTCQQTHARCVAARRRVGKLPKRVLDISHVAGMVLLRETESDDTGNHATLSFCWGTGVALRATTSNIGDHYAGIPTDSFPATLKDAIVVAQKLGIPLPLD
jgi:hypothetical protein